MSGTDTTAGAHDYAIVGGSAGGVLAARLTEDPGVRCTRTARADNRRAQIVTMLHGRGSSLRK